ncbi:hypothetical protein [Nitriliruptor alkaliphilus]|uniref:hypothetical protein n=1 Tax=Nitriliruptor alkaliphilus TaxID=427918 RepID=UPI000697DBAF|nr:hypothetical protein [Nitriliruptor alkaliphilus]
MPSREWVTIDDPADDHRRYTFDISFLLSGYRCIYGQGCEGIHPGEQDPAIGCCLHGAYLNDDDEAAFYDEAVREHLDPTTMQYHATALEDGIWETDEDGDVKTRVVDGGCLFANRTGWPSGEGCSLHHLAERKGEHYADWKPTVCWQVPLHRTIEESTANDGETLETHLIAAYERGHWGEGGADFGWWCLDDDTAFVSATPVYRSMETELRRMVGDAVYDELAEHLDGRRRQRNTVSFLPVV